MRATKVLTKTNLEKSWTEKLNETSIAHGDVMKINWMIFIIIRDRSRNQKTRSKIKNLITLIAKNEIINKFNTRKIRIKINRTRII